jgi:glycosyltransferase involved in cell wall biosynthesis
MRLVVFVQDYPSDERPSTSAFVHSRNLWYKQQGIDVSVASFSCVEPYEFEGLPVAPASRPFPDKAGLLVSHAPNVRNHVRVLQRCRLPIVFFFHGFEVLRTRRYYPEPFFFQRTWRDPLRRAATDAYDVTKLLVLGRFLARKRTQGCSFVFVSEWMRDQFVLNVPDGEAIIADRAHVIPNAVHESFVGARYDPPVDPDADFVTFRPSVDPPKYAIDAVVDLARTNAAFTFDIYGRGELLRRLSVPQNVRHFDISVPQSELASRANRYRCALIPSRLDAQGVTACEMATLGIPTIVSDLSVARDVLGGFANVAFLGEGESRLADLAARLWSQPVPAQRTDFLPSTTCAKEVEVFAETMFRSTQR